MRRCPSGDILIGAQERHRDAAGRPRHRDDVPELRAVSASQRARQRRVLAEDARRRQGRAARQGDARMLELVAMTSICGAPAGAAVGRPAAARRARPRADHRAADPPARRAAVGARSVPAHQDARRAQAAAEGARHHLRARHPQPGRGDGARRPHRRDERRPHRAGGSPREVFNAPRTEFVAQFIGGHNVIATRTAARSPCAPTG